VYDLIVRIATRDRGWDGGGGVMLEYLIAYVQCVMAITSSKILSPCLLPYETGAKCNILIRRVGRMSPYTFIHIIILVHCCALTSVNNVTDSKYPQTSDDSLFYFTVVST